MFEIILSENQLDDRFLYYNIAHKAVNDIMIDIRAVTHVFTKQSVCIMHPIITH